jgi:hypothetical protein
MIEIVYIALILCVYGVICFAIGVVSMLSYKRMAVRQLEYIMATKDGLAYSAMSYANDPRGNHTDGDMDLRHEQNELDRMYLSAMANGTVGDEEIERLGTTDNIVS